MKTINEALTTQKSLKSNANQQNSGSAASGQEQTNSQPTSEAGSLKRANELSDSPVLSQKDKEKHAQELIKELRVKKAKEEEVQALEREKNRIRTGEPFAIA